MTSSPLKMCNLHTSPERKRRVLQGVRPVACAPGWYFQQAARRSALVLVALALVSQAALAQPTYKLEVKPQLKPLLTIKLDGTKISRTDLAEDPGFRLQYQFKKDGKPLAIVEARSHPTVETPDKTPGTYSVVVELFYPGYQTGDKQKGQFRPVSNMLVYQIKPPAQAGGAVQVVKVADEPAKQPSSGPAGKPALVIQCGKENGAKERELVSPGYDYKLVKGSNYDGWNPPAKKSHCWIDKEKIQFDITMPAGVEGNLRLYLLDAEDGNRILILTADGKSMGSAVFFTGAGLTLEYDVPKEDTKDGKVQVLIQNFNKLSTAVVSTVEFIPAEKK